jgi:hypothetical protein
MLPGDSNIGVLREGHTKNNLPYEQTLFVRKYYNPTLVGFLSNHSLIVLDSCGAQNFLVKVFIGLWNLRKTLRP